MKKINKKLKQYIKKMHEDMQKSIIKELEKNSGYRSMKELPCSCSQKGERFKGCRVHNFNKLGPQEGESFLSPEKTEKAKELNRIERELKKHLKRLDKIKRKKDIK